MTVSTISTSLRNFITLGSGAYADVLTVTSTGAVNPGNFLPRDSTSSYPSVTVETAASRLVNAGRITGGVAQGVSLTSYPGGESGVVLRSGQVWNYGGIYGGGARADRAALQQSGGTLHNDGVIAGGFSETGSGVGLNLQGGVAYNASSITGGAGASGVSMSGGVLVNTGQIAAGGVYLKNDVIPIIGEGVDLSGGTLINAGAITSTTPYGAGIGVKLLGGGTLINAGMITQVEGALTSGTVSTHTPQIINTGTIADGVSLSTGGEIIDSGLIGAFASGTAIYFGRGDADLLLVPGAVLEGGISATASYTKTIYTPSGSGPVFPTIVTITDVNTLELSAGTTAGSIDLGQTFVNFNTVDFDPDTQWVFGAGAAALHAVEDIAGFTLGDTLVVDDFAATGLSYVSGIGLEVIHNAATLVLTVTGDFTGETFTYSTSGVHTSIVLESAPCFCAGTLIRTDTGETPVEALRAGDLVATLHGGMKPVRWLGTRMYDAAFIAGNHLMCPVRIAAGALGQDVPRRDLWVSPGHALYCDGVLVPAWRLINGVSITQPEVSGQVKYFHVELEEHDVVFAEHCPAESYFDNGGRLQFQNAAQAPAGITAALRCAPLLEGGFVLAAVQARFAARAGLAPAAPRPPGALHGFVDLAGSAMVAGWAQDPAAPEAPVCLDILADGCRIGRVLANEFRADLRAAGLGSGCHAFSFVPPAGTAGVFEVRRAADQATLSWTDAARAA